MPDCVLNLLFVKFIRRNPGTIALALSKLSYYYNNFVVKYHSQLVLMLSSRACQKTVWAKTVTD